MKARTLEMLMAVCILAGGQSTLVAAEAELPIEPDFSALGGEEIDSESGPGGKKRVADPAGPHQLRFADGRRLHGTLEAVDIATDELRWRRSDISGALRFSPSEIARVAFDIPPDNLALVHDTVKFVGTDWLAANVQSMANGKVNVKLANGSALAIPRAQIDWIHFAKGQAVECYDGPRSLSGWTGENWIFREGALRASAPATISRVFERLPDRVEYDFEVVQKGGALSFTIELHAKPGESVEPSRGSVRLHFRNSSVAFQRFDADGQGSQTANLKIAPDAANPVTPDGAEPERTFRITLLEDRLAGRMILFFDGAKAAEWTAPKANAGRDSGCVRFQSITRWNRRFDAALARVQVRPWDGRVPRDGEPAIAPLTTDRVVFADGDGKDGVIESIGPDRVKLRTGNGVADVPRGRIATLRFHRSAVADEEPPIARMDLGRLGEFDATAMSYRAGKLLVRTNFGGEFALAPTLVRTLDFLRGTDATPKIAPVLVFKNGDRLLGAIESGGTDRDVAWRLAGREPVSIAPTAIAGLVLPRPPDAPAAQAGTVARLRNGDWLRGEFDSLDGERLAFDTPAAGRVNIPRPQLLALYLSAACGFSDGAADHSLWTKGITLNQEGTLARSDAASAEPAGLDRLSAWDYFDGAFTVRASGVINEGPFTDRAVKLARTFGSLPERVEIEFEANSPRLAFMFWAQFFASEQAPGYLFHFSGDGLEFYDCSSREVMGRGVGPQAVRFGTKVETSATRRRFRLLADRVSGRLMLLVDGVLVWQYAPREAAGPRNLGNTLVLWAAGITPCTVSNIRIAPWNGEPSATESAPESTPMLLLSNGDETRGEIESVSQSGVKIASPVGALEIPLKRVVLLDFGGEPASSSAHSRLHLASGGLLSVESFQVENDRVTAQHSVLGRIVLPLESVAELVFQKLDSGVGP